MDDRFITFGGVAPSQGRRDAQIDLLSSIGELDTYRRGQPGFEGHPLCDVMDICLETTDPIDLSNIYSVVRAHNQSSSDDRGIGFWISLGAVKAMNEISPGDVRQLVRARGFSPHVKGMVRLSDFFSHGMIIDRGLREGLAVFRIYWFTGDGYFMEADSGRRVLYRVPTECSREEDIMLSARSFSAILAQ